MRTIAVTQPGYVVICLLSLSDSYFRWPSSRYAQRVDRKIFTAKLLCRWGFLSYTSSGSMLINMAAVAGQICETLSCGKPAKLQCPTCIKLNIQGSFFCEQVKNICFLICYDPHAFRPDTTDNNQRCFRWTLS